MRQMGVASTSISDTVVCLASQPMAHEIGGLWPRVNLQVMQLSVMWIAALNIQNYKGTKLNSW